MNQKLTGTTQSMARGAATRTANMNKRRTQILACAGEIIANEGVDSLTLSKLATKAEVTIPTIHNLIGKKEQIYELLIDEMMVKVEKALATQESRGLIQSAETFIDSLINLFRANEALYRAAFIVGERIGFFNQVSSDGIYQRSLKLAESICANAVESGELLGQIETTQMARQVFSCQRISRYDWMNGYIDLDAYRTHVLTGMYIVYGIDASAAMRKQLVNKVRELHASKPET